MGLPGIGRPGVPGRCPCPGRIGCWPGRGAPGRPAGAPAAGRNIAGAPGLPAGAGRPAWAGGAPVGRRGTLPGGAPADVPALTLAGAAAAGRRVAGVAGAPAGGFAAIGGATPGLGPLAGVTAAGTCFAPGAAAAGVLTPAAGTSPWAAGVAVAGAAGAGTGCGRSRAAFAAASCAILSAAAFASAAVSASAASRKCLRTFSAAARSIELEWVFFSVTPTSGR